MMGRFLRICVLWGLGWLVCEGGAAAEAERPTFPLTDLTLEQLMNTEVALVSRHPERVFGAASAIAVLTSEEIRRSGATSVPELLRTVPGMQVANVDSHTWAISARGFNSMFANKLLVLIDGRAVYSPLFGGVFWDVQDTLLEDIDRIEVIRGPGATLWGANAVNGVINIVTKNAEITQGWLASAAGGSELRAQTAARYGGQLGDSTYWRAFGKWQMRDDAALTTGGDAADQWNQARGGFRVDSFSESGRYTLQGDLYDGRASQTYRLAEVVPPFGSFVNDPLRMSGGNVLGRASHVFDNDAQATLQAYYDRAERSVQIFKEVRDTVDLDFQLRFPWLDWQQIVVGAGYRWSHDETEPTEWLIFSPAAETLHYFSGFVQDEISIVPEKLVLSGGTKLEHNEYTGLEYQPSVRLSWRPTPRQTYWGAVSRAVRTPARSDRGLNPFSVDSVAPGGLFPGSPPALIQFLGNPDFHSERVLAYELGTRLAPVDWLSLDVATFYNVISGTRSIERGAPTLIPGPPTHLVIPIVVGNQLDGAVYGVETAVRWAARPWWRFDLAHTFLRLHITPRATSVDSDREEGDVPRHQFSLRTSLTLPNRVEFDCGVRFVDSLATQNVPSYLVLDARLGWRPAPNWELAVVGQNLFDDRHPEFSSLFTVQRTEVEHSVYGKVTWHY